MGVKLFVVCVLALLMTIPSFFVGGLVDERAQRAADNASSTIVNHGGQQTILGSSIREVDTYRSVTRSLKYVLLFLGLVFLAYFVFEATSGKRVHPAQYVLVGTAQIIFFLLLLSLAEKIGFDFAFLLAGGSTVALLSANAGWIFGSRLQGIRALVIFSLLYLLIYLLLRLEDDALLIGAIASFLAVAAAMYFTRGIDWYSSLTLTRTTEQQAPSASPGDRA
jgi:inner membrane protein